MKLIKQVNWLKKSRSSIITKIENYFNSEISQRKLCSNKLSKYVTTFDHINKAVNC